MQNCSKSSSYSFALKFEALNVLKLMQKCSNWKYSNNFFLLQLNFWEFYPDVSLSPPPGTLERGRNVKYHLISVTKSISKIFVPIFVCVLTNKRY